MMMMILIINICNHHQHAEEWMYVQYTCYLCVDGDDDYEYDNDDYNFDDDDDGDDKDADHHHMHHYSNH